MRKPGIVFIILLLLATSCFYTDNATYFEEIVPEYDPTIQFTSNIDTIDNVTVRDSLLFSYTVAIDSGTLYYSDVYLGNLLLFRSDTVSDSLWIYPDYVNTSGEHELILVSYFKSYSGTLADKLNADFISADTSWTLNLIREEVK